MTCCSIPQTCLGLVGLLGNLLTVYVLSRHSMRNSFNHLLIVLSCLDTIFILFTILDYSLARGKSSFLYFFLLSIALFQRFMLPMQPCLAFVYFTAAY
jgi:hypothetical protein